jgi:hypothetical protein
MKTLPKTTQTRIDEARDRLFNFGPQGATATRKEAIAILKD